MAGEWQEVPGGWMQAPDPDEPDVDYFEADRLPRVARRARIIGEAADLMALQSLTPEESFGAVEAAGLGDDVADAAGHVVLLLEQIERQRYPDE
jgi:hypothetical protein